jgi:NAD-reducing hydrogenase small subunit
VKARVATAWLGGCSGCHMSLLDLDERLLGLAARMDLVYGPLVDEKEFPRGTDVTLVEGAVANEEHLALVQVIRARTRILVAFGDCAVSGNVTAMRNVLGSALPVLDRVYRDPRLEGAGLPSEPGILPSLLDRVLPVHHVVPVDHFLPGCPPHPDLIHDFLSALLDRKAPAVADQLRFG